MAEPKTQPRETDPADFLATVEPARKREEARQLDALFRRVTGEEPCMWGPSIIGFGRYAYTYDSGHSGEACMVGFSPRKANMVIYVLAVYAGLEEKLARLGKHKTGQSCLYLGSLDRIDLNVLGEIVTCGVAHMRRKYQTWDV